MKVFVGGQFQQILVQHSHEPVDGGVVLFVMPGGSYGAGSVAAVQGYIDQSRVQVIAGFVAIW